MLAEHCTKHRNNHQRSDLEASAERRNAQHQQRKGKVELLFHTQAPQVQQRLFDGLRGKVAAIQIKIDIGNRECGGKRRIENVSQLIGRQQYQREEHGERNRSEQRRKQPNNPARVETRKPERTGGSQLMVNEPEDNEPGNGEEDIHAQKPARAPARIGVKQHNKQHGEAA